MKHKLNDSKYIAEFLANNFEKEEIIPEIFELFKIDCMERCSFDPSRLDEKIMKFNDKAECDVVLLEDIISFIITGRENVKKRENELYKKISAAVIETLTSDIKFGEISKQLHISYYYMCHLVKDKSGVPLNAFRNRKRLEIAMKLLVTTDEKIADIATKCGYNSIGYFTEVFSKSVGVPPTVFRANNKEKHFHDFYEYDDMLLAAGIDCMHFLDENLTQIFPSTEEICVYHPDENFKFLHEAAIIEYHGVLYASWYLCHKIELNGYTPICGRRSYDKGATWTEIETLCSDETEKLMYCPPVYGICDDKLYLMVNTMVAPDYMHSLALYVLNNDTQKFEFLWEKPIPFKFNTNVFKLSNGKLMHPGRTGVLDCFHNVPAVMISDSGKIDDEWRLINVAPDCKLPDGQILVYPEMTVIESDKKLYMFNRNDYRRVPLVYVSEDMGESWSELISHDIPYVSSKIYCLTLSDGRHVMVCNTDKFNRTKLVMYITDDSSMKFTKYTVLFDNDKNDWENMHYPCVCEYDGQLYVIATKGYPDTQRGAALIKINIKDLK